MSNTSSDLVAKYGAQVLLDSLDASNFQSSDRVIIDNLRHAEQVAIFEELMQSATASIICSDDNLSHKLKAIERNGYLIVPYIALDVSQHQDLPRTWPNNAGNTEFASRLRDFYALSADIPRVLLVFTAEGNETQNSARDVHKGQPRVTLEKLAKQALLEHKLNNSDLNNILSVYLKAPKPDDTPLVAEPWETTLSRLEEFLISAATTKPEKVGALLPRLGCFMADNSETFASEDGLALSLIPQREQRSLGTSRLETNAATFQYLNELFDDPLHDTRQELEKTLEPQSAEKIAESGKQNFANLDVSSLKKKQDGKRDKVLFADQEPTVIGAGFSHFLKLDKGEKTAKILLVAAQDAFSIEMPLEQAYKPEEAFLRLLQWDDKKKKVLANRLTTSLKENIAVFNIPIVDKFTVFQAASLTGPRSLRNHHDDFLIAVYPTELQAVVAEIGDELSLDEQAWLCREEQATFKVFSPDGSGLPREERLVRDHQTHNDSIENGDDGLDIESDREERTLLDGKLSVHIGWLEEPLTTAQHFPILEVLPYLKGGEKTRINNVFALGRASQTNYLTAIQDFTRGASNDWHVSFPDGKRVVLESHDQWGQERAVAQILQNPDVIRIERDHDDSFTPERFPHSLNDHLTDFLNARREVFDAVLKSHQTPNPTHAPWMLIDLQSHAELVENYLRAWLELIEAECNHQRPYQQTLHSTLLHLDQLINTNEDRLARLTVLPTHPWLMAAQLHFQRHIQSDLRQAKDLKHLHLKQSEVLQLIPRRVMEDWYYNGSEHLQAEDGAPFCWEYLPKETFRQSAKLDYVERVISNNIKRYLDMHPHLRHERRTLRLAFLYPGDGKHLLAGLKRWINSLKRGSEFTAEDTQKIPRIDVQLFDDKSHRASAQIGSALDAFFRTDTSHNKDDKSDSLLRGLLRYRKSTSRGPQNEHDYAHICFMQGLVDNNSYQPCDIAVEDGWDGCYGDGLLATSLHRSQRSGEQSHSERGLWIGKSRTTHNGPALPRGLRALSILLRSSKFSRISPDLGIFWKVTLPNLENLNSVYEHSDWAVHLDRELTLDLFKNVKKDRLQIIEYSDQEVPDIPGYDVITVTRHAEPYLDQLESVLQYVNLVNDSNPREHARRTSELLLKDINILSGSWALNFLMGNIALNYRNRLKGDIGCALAYRWITQSEDPAHHPADTELPVPIFLSLEELIRATPNTGLPVREGWNRRYNNEIDGESNKFCDDLLALYIMPTRAGEPTRIYGRIIEVKFGDTAHDQHVKTNAVEQVRNTYQLLSRFVSGQNSETRGERIFRDKQLSLLLKTQIEQARYHKSSAQLDRLNINELSTNIASGNYTIDYLLGHDHQDIRGDVFLLSTKGEHDGEQEHAVIQVLDGVRLISMSRRLLKYIAFEQDHAPTLYHSLPDTRPSLGASQPFYEPTPQPIEQSAPPVSTPPSTVVEPDVFHTQASESALIEDTIPEFNLAAHFTSSIKPEAVKPVIIEPIVTETVFKEPEAIIAPAVATTSPIPSPKFRDLTQPQIELQPMNRERMMQLSQRLRELRGELDDCTYEHRLSDAFFEQLMERLFTSTNHQQGITPRGLIRCIVHELELVKNNPDYVPDAQNLDLKFMLD